MFGVAAHRPQKILRTSPYEIPRFGAFTKWRTILHMDESMKDKLKILIEAGGGIVIATK